MTERRRISSGSPFERDIGYSRAVVDGDWVFVSGTTGFDYATMAISDDVAEQAEQVLVNIALALTQAGRASTTSCACAICYRTRTTSRPAGRRCGGLSPSRCRRRRCRSCALADPRMKIEIEVTARVH